jgi:hypothetical protein
MTPHKPQNTRAHVTPHIPQNRRNALKLVRRVVFWQVDGASLGQVTVPMAYAFSGFQKDMRTPATKQMPILVENDISLGLSLCRQD